MKSPLKLSYRKETSIDAREVIHTPTIRKIIVSKHLKIATCALLYSSPQKHVFAGAGQVPDDWLPPRMIE
jgi:hypothetical protein